jgi:photosystem II stability/assembly factor-like uncharacterized protein
LRLGAEGVDLVESFDGAPGRQDWYTPWGAPPDARSIAIDGDRLYVNVHVGGILCSVDGGATWSPTLDVDDDVHQVTVDGDGTVWAATGASALAESRDGGETWIYHRTGLDGRYLRCVAVVTGGLLVTGSSGPHAHDGVVYRFDGDAFHVCDQGLPARFDGNIDTFRVSAKGDLAAVAGLDGRLYVTEDAGSTWSEAAGDIGNVRAVVVT